MFSAATQPGRATRAAHRTDTVGGVGSRRNVVCRTLPPRPVARPLAQLDAAPKDVRALLPTRTSYRQAPTPPAPALPAPAAPPPVRTAKRPRPRLADEPAETAAAAPAAVRGRRERAELYFSPQALARDVDLALESARVPGPTVFVHYTDENCARTALLASSGADAIEQLQVCAQRPSALLSACHNDSTDAFHALVLSCALSYTAVPLVPAGRTTIGVAHRLE